MTEEPGGNPKLVRVVWIALARMQLVMAMLIFLPAWTLRYWQGWLYWTVCLACFSAITLDLARHDQVLLARRMKGGPSAEARPLQKRIMAVASASVIALLVVSALDHRFGSAIPLALVLAGDVAVVLGFWIVYRVFRANRFAAATIQVEAGQALIDTGPYAVVRHPMYAGGMLALLGTPLALGSAWGLIVVVPLLAALLFRLLDEERLLHQELPGYAAYCERTRYRLVPAIW